MADRIQEGIRFRPGERPQPHFAIAFLDRVENATFGEVRAALTEIWSTLRALQQGVIADVPGQVFDPMSLSVLIGYGSRFFELIPAGLKPPELKRFRPPAAAGGGVVSLGSGLSYEANVTSNPADSAVTIQFTGDSALTVRRAILETWKSLERTRANGGTAPLKLIGSYTGLGREDKRSWIDFFDGTSNIRSDQRLDVIQIKERTEPAPDRWKEGGTYLCFIRIRVAIGDWNRLPRAQQELIVGRDKVTGCSLVSSAGGAQAPIAGCPFMSGGTVEDGQNDQFRDAARPPGSAILENSHIHRANHGRQNAQDADSRLVFRQGYEFFEGIHASGEPDLGLNFVSFQDTPERILGMIKTPGWLGGVNFGGDPADQPTGLSQLLRVHAAGFFVVPPREADESLPGRGLF